jgi:hypothetical protein
MKTITSLGGSMLGISGINERPLASEEGLSSMELIT